MRSTTACSVGAAEADQGYTLNHQNNDILFYVERKGFSAKNANLNTFLLIHV